MNAQPLIPNDPIHATRIVEELTGYRFHCTCGASEFTPVSRQQALQIAAEHRHEMDWRSGEPAAPAPE